MAKLKSIMRTAQPGDKILSRGYVVGPQIPLSARKHSIPATQEEMAAHMEEALEQIFREDEEREKNKQ